MIEFRMPSLGADMEDGTLIEWRVSPGEEVARGQVICVVDTQKGAIDVEVWEPGTVAQLVVEPGQKLPVGATMALLAEPGEDWRTAAVTVPPASPAMAPRASPAARRRAAELGVDLASLATGAADAPISIADVERAAGPVPVQTPQQAMRDAIAAAMVRSSREIPHYYLGAEIDVEASLAWLETFNANRPPAGRILFVALVLRAIGQALREAPELNGSFVDGRFRASKAINVGMVTALRGGGLVVPTIRDVDRLELPDLMSSLHEVLSRARGGRLRSSDLSDSTITVSNMGELGAETVYGLIYPPQVALVGLGRVASRPIVRDGSIVAARTMHATLSGDHRVTDGLVGARFLAALRERLERPEAK